MQKLWLKFALILIAVACLSSALNAQEGYQPTPANLEARHWFQDAKLGMFIHWGVYSVMSDGEWVMEVRHIPAKDYEKLAAQFGGEALGHFEILCQRDVRILPRWAAQHRARRIAEGEWRGAGKRSCVEPAG